MLIITCFNFVRRAAKGEQPFGATRTPRLYGAAAAARNSVAYWFAKAVTIVSLRAFIRIYLTVSPF